jgi:Uma2 family endonuclease
MSVALEKPWTAEKFLAWAATQEQRHEFDGLRPLAMTGGNARHSRITGNIHAALRSRLRGTPCAYYGPDLAVRTEGEKIRSPDALITCTKFPDTDLIAPDPVVIFEVLSANSGRTDRIDKVREYALIPSMRRYVIVETKFPGLLVLHRQSAEDAWTASPLTGEDMLAIPEVSLTIPVSELYETVDFEQAEARIATQHQE